MISGVTGVRDVIVRFLGEPGDLTKATGEAEGGLNKFGAAAKVVAAGALVGLAAGIKSCTQAAMESEESQSRMEAGLKSVGISYESHKKQIDDVIQSTSQLAGLDDEDLQNAFTKVTRATGDVTESLKDTALAADITRGAHISLEAATKLVTNTELGRSAGLRRIGVDVDTVTTKQTALKREIAEYTAAHGKLSEAEKEHFNDLMTSAKASDKAQTAQNALTMATEKYSGAAKAYGDTAEGAMDRFSVESENLREQFGEKLMPIITVVMGQLVSLLGFVSNHATVVEIFAAAIGGVSIAILGASVATRAWLAVLNTSPIILAISAIIALGAALVMAYEKSETFRNVVDTAFSDVKAVVTGFVSFFTEKLPNGFEHVLSWTRGHWPEIATIISGPFAPLTALATNAFGVRSKLEGAFSDIKDDTRAVVGAVVDFFTGLPGKIESAAVAVGKAFVSGISNGLSALGDALARLIKTPINAVIDAWNALGVPSIHIGFDTHIPGVGKIGFDTPSINLPDIPKLAGGGQVDPYHAYIVGDAGPELFVPNVAGYVVPNGAGAPAMPSRIEVPLVVSGKELARLIIDPLRSEFYTIARANRSVGLA